jgi:hypothetical protein
MDEKESFAGFSFFFRLLISGLVSHAPLQEIDL